MNWAVLVGVLLLVINWRVSNWDDLKKLRDRTQRTSDLKRKVTMGLVCLIGTIGFLIYSDRSSENQRKEISDGLVTTSNQLSSITKVNTQLTGKLDAASNSVRSLGIQLSDLTKKYDDLLITNSLNENLAKASGYALVESKLSSAQDKQRLYAEIITEKYNPTVARESLANRWEMQRLEAIKARLDEERDAPAKRLAEETAKKQEEELLQKRTENTLSQYLGYCDYALASLQNILRDRAKESGKSAKLSWDCQDIRSLLETNGTCEIREEAPSAIVYSVAFSGFFRSAPSIRMRITCVSGSISGEGTNRSPSAISVQNSYTNSLQFNFSQRHYLFQRTLELTDSSGYRTYTSRTNISSYKKEVYSALAELVAAQP